MDQEEINRLISLYFSKELTQQESKQLLDELKKNNQLVKEMVRQAQVEQLLNFKQLAKDFTEINWHKYDKKKSFIPFLRVASLVLIGALGAVIGYKNLQSLSMEDDNYLAKKDKLILLDKNIKVPSQLSIKQNEESHTIETSSRNKKIVVLESSVDRKTLHDNDEEITLRKQATATSGGYLKEEKTKSFFFKRKASSSAAKSTLSAESHIARQEKYSTINANNFKEVINQPLSTFSIDVDTASYSNMRRFINSGQLPPKDSVRTEEFINYFTYDSLESKNGEKFAYDMSVSQSPWSSDNLILKIAVETKLPIVNDKGNNFVFLIDVSGSMNQTDKLFLIKKTFRPFLNQLKENDRVAIVVYAGQVGVALPSTKVFNKELILAKVDSLGAGGITNGSGGIKEAYKIAKENFIEGGNNRIILASDGDFNVGISSVKELEKFISEKKNQGIFLTTLGFGTGNYNDSIMEILADKGNGNYFYIDSFRESRRVFEVNMAQTTQTVAKDVKIQIEFNPSKIASYRLIGYENRLLKAKDFNNDKKDAGEVGVGQKVIALYELMPVGSSKNGVDALRYQKQQVKVVENKIDELLTFKLRYKDINSSESKLITSYLPSQNKLSKKGDINSQDKDFIWSVAIASFAELMRQSQYLGKYSIDNIIALATLGIGEDVDGTRKEALELMKSYKSLTK